jgi:signal transduction histidine kinase
MDPKQPVVSFERLLLALITLVLISAVVPAGVIIDRRLRGELMERSRDDLARANRILQDRIAVESGALMMHAKEMSLMPELVAALGDGRIDAAAAAAARTAADFGESPVLFVGGESRAGPPLPDSLLGATQRGEMPVTVLELNGSIYSLGLAPLFLNGDWIGATGVTRRWGDAEAAILSTLTRSDVMLLTSAGDVVGTTLTDGSADAMDAARLPAGEVVEIESQDDTWFAMRASLGGGSALFTRGMAREMAVADAFRRIGVVALATTLVLAILAGLLVTRWLAAPLRALAHAAERLSVGDFDVPLARPRFRELGQVAETFESMRASLSARIDELRQANAELADRQERLAALQVELIRQDRLAASGRLVAQLAHEVRNPVANVRNCLELLKRKVTQDATATEYLDIAVEELRRMHGLAERLLDLHRPGDASASICDAEEVAGKVAALSRIGPLPGPDIQKVSLHGDDHLPVAMPGDVLTQILSSLVQNAVEAMPSVAGRIEVRLQRAGRLAFLEVLDEGPGIPAEVLPRVFDPFFTTKRSVQGVGLGLFVAEAMARSHGGRLTAANRPDRRGAAFRLQVEVVAPVAAAGAEVHA